MSIYSSIEHLRRDIEEKKATLLAQRDTLSASARYEEARRCTAAIDATEEIYQAMRRCNVLVSLTCHLCRIEVDPYRCSNDAALDRSITNFPDVPPGGCICNDCCRKRLTKRGGECPPNA
jgi:hypothetical protein